MTSRRALVVIGSATDERDFGLASGHRIANALDGRGWGVTVQDAADLQAVVAHLRRANTLDLVVPVGFGAGIEDGTVYTLARAHGVPCAGPAPATGVICLDKRLFHTVVNGLFDPNTRVRVPETRELLAGMSRVSMYRRIRELNPPILVKNTFGGSSIGLSVCTSRAEAVAVAGDRLPKSGSVLAQELVAPSREFSVTILDRDRGPKVLPVVELMRDTVMSYQDKFGLASASHHVVPARLSSAARRRVVDTCLRVHAAIRACGLTRYDLLIAGRDLFLLEANAIPGLLPSSIAVHAAAAAGLTFEDLAEAYAMSAFIQRVEPRATSQPAVK